LGVAVLVVASLAGLAPTIRSAETRIWSETAESLVRGSADGVAVSGRGALFMAPKIVRWGDAAVPGQPHQVWSVAADRLGNIYLGTGPDGAIIKITPGSDPIVFYTVDEPLVTALVVTQDDQLLAGTAPGGKIYRIDRDGTGALWSETGERYVWALAVAEDGGVFAGTGERGGIQRIDRSGTSEPFFDSDEPHVVSLLPLPGGGLLAGGAGRGLVYEVDSDGNGIVRYDGDLPEVTALAEDGSGGIVAALVAPPSRKAKRPALEITLPDGTRVGTADETVGALEARRGPVLRGTIEGLAEPPAAAAPALRGRVVRIGRQNETTELWRSSLEAPLCLLGSARGEILFGTGEPARLYRVDARDEVALLGTLDEAQATGLLRLGRAVLLATSNPAAAYRVGDEEVDAALFTSRPHDAGGPARWGSFQWKLEQSGGRVELYTRTGNGRQPDATWSAWSPVMTDPAESRVVNPDGRFMQWRARFVGAQGTGVRLARVTVHYEPFNRPPVVRGLRLEGEAGSVSGEATFVWSATDPDGDPVDLQLSYQAEGAAAQTALGSAITGGGEGTAPRDGRLVWDTAQVDEARYRIRAVATDQAANDPDEGRTVEIEPALSLTVDRTPPELSVEPLGARSFEVRVRDSLSELRRLELQADGETRFSLRPLDGVCDSREETFRVVLPGGDEAWSVRGADAAGNVAQVELTPS
jgi:hypothetical protein